MARKGYAPMERQPWHMQPGESVRAFERFCVYRDLGPTRSIAKAQRACGEGMGTLREWEHNSSKYHWVARVRAYEQHLDNERTEQVLEHWKQNSAAAADLVWAVLVRFGDHPSDITSHDLPHLLREASKLSFLLSGTPTERLRQDVEATVREESEQANAAFLALFRQLTGSEPPQGDE